MTTALVAHKANRSLPACNFTTVLFKPRLSELWSQAKVQVKVHMYMCSRVQCSHVCVIDCKESYSSVQECSC